MQNYDDLAVNTAKKQRGKPFESGKSGNPNGRPKGSRNKVTLAALALLGDEAEEITRVLIEKAKEGDMAAIKLAMDRICPPSKDVPISFDIKNISTLDELIVATNQLVQSVGSGEVAPHEAQMVASLIEQQRKTIISSMKYFICNDF